MARKHYSPLRYPGGKAKMYDSVLRIMADNNICNPTYIEPFAGGAGVALRLLIEGKAETIVINDFDISIYAFWHSVVNRGEELIRMIKKTPITLKERERQMNIQLRKNDMRYSLLTIGFSTFYLNRVNVSGIIKGGPLGGNLQESKYKIDCRYNKENLIERIRLIMDYRDRVIVTNLDAKVFLAGVNEYGNNLFMFIDPPYYVKGGQLYMNSFTREDHIELRNSIVKYLDIPYIITYDNVSEITELYNEFNKVEFELLYSAGKHSLGKEVLLYRNDLVINI